MEDLSVSFLNDKFNMYYEAAKKAYAEKKGDLAKRNYLLAAETLLQLAKKSSPKLRQARTQRAKRLVEIAENIDVAVEKERIPKGELDDKAGSQDGEKEWTSATIPNIHFDDIAGLEDVKKAITTRMINPIKYPEKYKLYNKKTGGGVLLYGPPGTGKTMIAKAIACEVGAKFYFVKGSDVVSKWVGESEKNIASLFRTAREDDLAIIFLDEMDSLIGKRGVDTHNDKRVNEFLQQIDGFAGSAPNLLLLGATNRPWDIDSAAMRSGRFSQKIYVPLPDAPARKFMFEKSLKGTPVSSDVNIDELVALSDGYSGADIEEVCDRAKEDPLLESIKTGGEIPVTHKNFVDAFAAVPPSVSTREVARFEKYMRGEG
ncbi:MAG: ATP-binding protein [Clostridia bacterium]|nr:ATP-binding protein [Clostridia bacterium]